jgi:hypothetical protein
MTNGRHHSSALLEPYAKNKKYDSQDMTEIGSYLLKREGVKHTTYFNHHEPRYWIYLNDYKLNVDFFKGELRFEKDDFRFGKPVKLLANSIQFEVITGEQP